MVDVTYYLIMFVFSIGLIIILSDWFSDFVRNILSNNERKRKVKRMVEVFFNVNFNNIKVLKVNIKGDKIKMQLDVMDRGEFELELMMRNLKCLLDVNFGIKEVDFYAKVNVLK